MKEAMFFESLDKNRVCCSLCAHHCVIADGKRGVCQVRENRGGTLDTLIYGCTISQHVDPEDADTKNGISAMARATGFSAAIGALFIGRGVITGNGIVPPENVIKGDLYEVFIEELEKRDIKVIEVSEIIG